MDCMTNPFAVLCVIGSCISLQLGASLAIQIFPTGGPWGTASLRLLFAAVILLLIARPRVREWSREKWISATIFGLTLGLMNGFFYAGIELVALGPAVTIEFLGPLLLAACLSRSLRDATCVALALIGMGLLGLDSFNGDPLDLRGVFFLLCAGAMWAAYILASKKAGALFSGQDGLAVAFLIGGLVLLPVGVRGAVALASDPNLLLLALGTGVLASLIPYSLEFIALRRLAPNVFSILIALEPVFAALFGWLLLSQNASQLKLAAIGLVVVASVLQTMVPARGRVVFRKVALRPRRLKKPRLPWHPKPRASDSNATATEASATATGAVT